MPKVTLTRAERKAGMDLRDMLPRAKKTRVSKEAKRENAARDELVRSLDAHGFGKSTAFEVESVEGSEREDVEVEVVVRFFIDSKIIDAELGRQTRVRGSRS